MKVLVTNADLAVGDMIAQDLLLGKNRNRFDEVVCSVNRIEHSGNLWTIGASVIRESEEKKEYEQHLRQVDTLVLNPDCTSRDFVKKAEYWFQAAKSANVRNCILISILGAEEDTETSKMFRELEEKLKKSGIETAIVVRHGFFQQCLFWLTSEIKQDGKVSLPWKQDEGAKCAPLNIYDLSSFVAHLCAESGESMRRRGGEIFKLTGPELFTGKSLVDRLNKNLGSQIRFEEVDARRFEEYLRNRLQFNEMMVHLAMDTMKLINSGKLNFVSNDEKKNTGMEPINVDRFVQENAHRFVKEK